MDLQLYYGPLFLGEIIEVFDHQGTWFGTFRPALPSVHDPLECRICEFIAFCEDFNAQCAAGDDPGPAGFDRFDDLLYSRLWQVRTPSGAVSEIQNAPNFQGDGEISWITV